MTLKRLVLALLVMGFTSLTAQTVLIREFFVTFNGNELTIGVVLANWLLLAAFGSVLGNTLFRKSRRPASVFAMLELGIALYLPFSVFLSRTVKNILAIGVGEGVGMPIILLASLVIPSLIAILTGMQFPVGYRAYGEASGRPLESAGKVYITESLGFAVAGPMITYLFIPRLDSFSIMFLTGLLNTALATVLAQGEKGFNIVRRPLSGVCLLLSCFMLISLFGFSAGMHRFSLGLQWKGRELVHYQNSIYGNLAVTKSDGQYTFYSNGIPIITTPVPDISSVEDLGHFTMLSHPDPKRALLIGGGAGGMLAEILRYPVEKVTYLELDPALIKLVRDFPTSLTEKELRDPRLDIVYADGRRFLNTVEAKYDIIMVNLPMPSTLQLNRFYTKEFFAEARRSIGDDGLLTLAVPGSLSQISSELRNLNATILSSLKDLFFVFVIPGYSNIYIAAKKEIFIAPNVLVSRLAERGVRTRTFNRSYLKERLSRQWAEWFDQLIWQYDRIGKNLDLAPRATFYAVSHWNALFSPGLSIVMRVLNRLNLGSILMAIALAAAIAYSASLHIRQPVKVIGGFAIFSTGFTVMALNLILIYAYQSFYGFVFHHIAVLASAFMIGLVAGGWLATRSLPLIRNNTAVFFGMESFAAVFSLAVGGILLYLDRQGAFRFPAVFFFLIMVTGALIGAEFPIVNKLCLKGAEGADTAGLLYALDLAGSWFAALIVSAALVPLIGIPGTCVALAMLKILSGALVVSGRD